MPMNFVHIDTIILTGLTTVIRLKMIHRGQLGGLVPVSCTGNWHVLEIHFDIAKNKLN